VFRRESRRKFRKSVIASLDVDPQKGFTILCPKELPVNGGHKIARELNANHSLSSVRIFSKDAHPGTALWKAKKSRPQGTSIQGYPNLDQRWNSHCVVGTKGFELIPGLPPVTYYDFWIYKGVERDMHPYGACYHDLAKKKSTGLIEFLKSRKIKAVIVGGLATDYCVCETVMELVAAGFTVILNLSACRAIAPETAMSALGKMRGAGVIVATNARTIKNKHVLS
jgi:nicotinamidase/pyrazinamidase